MSVKRSPYGHQSLTLAAKNINKIQRDGVTVDGILTCWQAGTYILFSLLFSGVVFYI